MNNNQNPCEDCAVHPDLVESVNKRLPFSYALTAVVIIVGAIITLHINFGSLKAEVAKSLAETKTEVVSDVARIKIETAQTKWVAEQTKNRLEDIAETQKIILRRITAQND